VQERFAKNDSEISRYGLSTCREFAQKSNRERVCRDDPRGGANNTMMHDHTEIFTMHVKLTKHAATCNFEDGMRLLRWRAKGNEKKMIQSRRE
jgi:hypothetical protein